MFLGVESSCDETALALFDPLLGLQGEWVASQITLHAQYGGVVPDLASREHLSALPPLLREVWSRCAPDRLRGVAVTAGPGLASCLAVGCSAARALGVALRIPIVPVNHLRAHAWSPFIPLHRASPTEFEGQLRGLLPHLGLIVSGGNSMLIELGMDLKIRILVETVDDAAGEALDKGAKLLGLGYPGGPRVEALALDGDSTKFRFPTALPERTDRRFSFSGLKTSLRYLLDSMTPLERAQRLPDICASYQAAVIEMLVRKLRLELQTGSFGSLGLSGGVANNRALRAAVQAIAQDRGLPCLCAEPGHTGDNAAMIVFAAWQDGGFRHPLLSDLAPWEIDPAWRIDQAVRACGATGA